MSQPELFDAADFYAFPEALLDYDAQFLPAGTATALMGQLLHTVPWQQSSRKMYDKMILTPRMTAWYADEDTTYQLGGTIIKTQQWTPELLALKNTIEARYGYRFNTVLLNLYRDGNDSVAWHRDRDSELGNRPVIASVSLGQVRNFEFRSVANHSSKYALPLHHGSLLIMKGNLQEHWEHRIAKSTLKMQPRINLTFRLLQVI